MHAELVSNQVLLSICMLSTRFSNNVDSFISVKVMKINELS